MSARPQRDWAERTAKQLFVKHYGAVTIDVVVRVLRRAEKRGYQRGKQDGYAEAFEYNAPDDGAGAG